MTTKGRSRDRHGRGVRGPLAPQAIPMSRSRSAIFDGLVLEAVERIERSLPELEDIEILVEEVPPSPVRGGAPDPISLGRIANAQGGQPARVIVHRRPIELRSTPGMEREDLVGDVITELVAELFGLPPQQVDPDYDNDSGRSRR